MRVVFADDSSLQVKDSVGDALKQALVSGVEFVEINGSMYRTSGIMKVVDTKPVDRMINTPLLVPPTTELTDEQRSKNIERIGQLKRKFLGDRHDSNT